MPSVGNLSVKSMSLLVVNECGGWGMVVADGNDFLEMERNAEIVVSDWE